MTKSDSQSMDLDAESDEELQAAEKTFNVVKQKVDIEKDALESIKWRTKEIRKEIEIVNTEVHFLRRRLQRERKAVRDKERQLEKDYSWHHYLFE